MNEASITKDLMAYLRQALPGADVWKVHDVSTKGRPDIQPTWRGYTSFLEVKLLRKGDTLRSVSGGPEHELQRFTMRRLQAQSYGRAWYVVFDARTASHSTYIIRVSNLDAGEPEEVADYIGEGFNYPLVAELIERTHQEDFRAAA